MTPPPSLPNSHAARRAFLWLLGAVFLTFAIADNLGRYSLLALGWLSLAILAALMSAWAPKWVPDSRRALNLALVASAVVFIALWLGSSVPDAVARPLWFAICAAIAALLAWFVARLSRIGRFGRLLFPAFLVLQMLLGIAQIDGAHRFEQTSPQLRFKVRHDVQWFNQEAARLLLAGQNPYAVRMQNVMGQDMPFYPPNVTGPDGKLPFGFVYMPLGLFFILPAYLLGDFRFAHAFALVGSAFFLGTARPSSTSRLAATLFLLFPLTPLVLFLSWTEPVAVFFLSATLFCAFRAPKMLPLALGCLICAKQYTVFMLPLVPLLVPEKEKWRPLMFHSLAIAAVLTLPLALWDVAGFFRSAVEMQFKQPFRVDSLSYLVAVMKMGGPQLSPALGFAALLGAIAWALKAAPRSAASWCGAGALTYLGFFALNKQAFANYYFWVFALLVSGVAVALPAEELHAEKD